MDTQESYWANRLMVTKNDVIELIEKGYVIVNTPSGLADLQEKILKGADRFFNMSQEEKDLYRIETTAIPNIGYVLRNKEAKEKGGIFDRKEYLHYQKDTFEYLMAYASVRPRAADDELFQRVANLDTFLAATTRKVAMFLDELLPGYDFTTKTKKGRRLNVMRLLGYMPDEAIAAQGHEDISFLTEHFDESHKGLMLGKNLDIPYRSEPGKALLFFGKKAEAICPKLKAMHHGVIQVPDTDDPRRSIVGFGHTD